MSVTVELQGRLGNNLFQIATGASLAAENKVHFIQPEWEHSKDFKLDFLYKDKQALGHVFHWTEPSYNFTKIPYYGPTKISGYFQSYKYFNRHDKYIKQLFMRNVEPDEKIYDFLSYRRGKISENSCVGIHVRRGDYLKLKDCHPVMSLDYYNNAVKLFPNSTLFVFSDDTQWCKDNFNFNNETVFISGNSAIVDFHSMTLCDNFIISNSSFSWWAAYLGGAINKKVISPNPKTNWFGSALRHYNMDDLIPNEWEIL